MKKPVFQKQKIKKEEIMSKLDGVTLPTCEILVNGQKRKLYGKKKNKVYLHNGDNFQLKLFNPLRERIGVQLRMNGVKVDNDLLIINPGQEMVVERYIGTNRKLTFSAYDIDTSTMSESKIKKVKKAIEKNGELEVVFWNEKQTEQTTATYSNLYIPFSYPDTTSGSTITFNSSSSNFTMDATDVVINGNLKINGNLTVDTGGGSSCSSGTSGYSGYSGIDGTSGFYGRTGLPGIPFTEFEQSNRNSRLYSSDLGKYRKPGIFASNVDYLEYLAENISRNINYTNFIDPNAKWAPIREQKLSKKIETGRIEKGDISNQHFSPITFEVGEEFYKIKFKLLPFSLKPVKKKLYDSTTIKNIINGGQTNTYIRTESAVREYCKCGYRISRGKGVWDFCPICGRKIKK